MKILLIDPPFYRFMGFYNRYFPFGLTCIAAVLRKEGHEVSIYDADCNRQASDIDYAQLPKKYPLYVNALNDASHPLWQEALATIGEFHPDIVGITVLTTKAASAFKLAALCKQHSRDRLVIMGGPHATLKAEEILQICPDVDLVVRGEGEVTLCQLIREIEKDTRNFNRIEGISCLQNEVVRHNAPRQMIMNLDDLPFPARELLMGRETYSSEDMGLLMTSRGCPFNCTYCATAIWRRATRYRSIPKVVAEIKDVINTHGTTQFSFKDDTFTVNRKRVLEFCDHLLADGIKIGWECNARVDTLDEILLRRMKEAGCNSIKIGVESGSDRILSLMGRRISRQQVCEAAALLKKTGIHWTGYFMMGLPGETVEDIQSTLNFMKQIQPDFASISTYEPFPGTKLFDFGVERGIVSPKMSQEDFNKRLPSDYYVRDPQNRVDTIDGATFRQLEVDMKSTFYRYNSGFRRIAKRVLSRRHMYMKDPRFLLGDFRKFLNWARSSRSSSDLRT